MKQEIGGYTYYSTKEEAKQNIKSKDDVLAYEGGLGWYLHSKKEYKQNPRKKLFGFQEDKMGKLKTNEFYSLKLKKVLTIPPSKVREVVKNGRLFKVGKYDWKGKEYEAWKVVGKAK